jgi:4'-phosphopantetheinyl transferase
LRAIIAAYLGIEPREVGFSYSGNGKPVLATGGPVFSFTHSGDLALVALAPDGEVGIDIEQVRPLADLDRLGARFLSSRELIRLGKLPAANRLRWTLAAWTRREAYLKALGVGVTGLDDTGVHDLWFGSEAADGELLSTGLAGWSVYHLEPAAEYVGAVAASGIRTVKSFRWP